MSYNWINTQEIKWIKGNRLILFGAGAGSEEFLYHHNENKLDSKIIAVTDNDPSYWGQSLFNYDIISPMQIKSMPFDKVVVTTISGRETVAHQLNGMGLSHNQDYILIGKYPRTYIANIKGFLKELDAKSLLEGSHCLHIGPGGFLGFEVLLYCFGAEKVCAVDKLPFDIHYPDITILDDDYQAIIHAIEEIAISEAEKKSALNRYRELFFLEDNHLFMDTGKIEFRYPMDMCELLFPDGSFDFVFSSSVLEHVTDPESAVSQGARVLKPGGYCYHTITTQDHRSFSKVGNFNPFSFRLHSTEEWEKIARKRFYQNRLLPVEWKRLHEKYDLQILQYHVECRYEVSDTQLNDYHPDFSRFSEKELSEAGCRILSRKGAHI